MLLLFACSPSTVPLPPATPSAEDWEVLAVHPWAEVQRTELGRVIWNLTPFHGHVFAGYGDWNDNTGPITLQGLTPEGTWSTGYEHLTEAATVMRVINGELWVPPIDPRFIAPGDFAVGVADGEDVSFRRERTLFDATHVLDVASDGTDLVATGSVDLDAALWKRSGDGAWEVFYTEPPASGQFARFYGLGPVHEGLIFQRADALGDDVPTASLLREGEVESLDFSLLPPGRSVVFRPTPFAGRLVYQTDSSFGRVESELYATDGASAEPVFDGAVRAFTVSGDLLYVLSGGAVHRTADLEAWEVIAEAPRGCWSLAVLEGLWCGSGRSEIHFLPTAEER